MGAPGKNSTAPNSMQRVKVYRLNDDGKWDDRGTGHVTVDYLEGTEDLGLFVIDEEDNDTLLRHRISSDDIYRRQEDTIISWRDPEFSTELALSFQETTGCTYIWDHICTVQRNLHFSTLSNLESGPRPVSETLETSQANDETFHSINSELREFPAVELSTLPLILKTVVESGVADQMHVVELILQDQEFFPKLMDLFRICEDLENQDGLHMIFKLVKGIILLNSLQIFDKIFGDEFIMDVIGSLEYDPEVPQVQRHRAFLKEHVVFKEAIPIKDPSVLSKIHQTYRVGYIKDVILPRLLDEATVANLNSIIHGNNAAVVSLLKDDSTFIQELFARMKSSTTLAESKRNLVLFLQEFCSLSKSLQLVQQLRLFRDLVNEGIFDIITDVLQSPDKRLVLTGTDILILFLNQDPNLLRTYVIQQEGNVLLGLLVKGMITDFGEDMHCQFLEIMRILLDSFTLSGSQNTIYEGSFTNQGRDSDRNDWREQIREADPDSLGKATMDDAKYFYISELHKSYNQRDTIVEIFYDKHLDQLIDTITASCPPRGTGRATRKSHGSGGRVETQVVTKPEILSNICELLCFCVLHHPYRIKCNFLANNLIEKVLFLTRRKEKYLVVAAVRFLRTIISRNDDHLHRHIVKNNLLKPIIHVFISNGNRYNLLNSAVLELLEYIRKENLKTLILYIVDCFWDQLAKFEYLGTIQALKVKYDQSLETFESRNTTNVADPRKRIDVRALEKEEEDYFNEDSDEEDTASARESHTRNQLAQPNLPNGTGDSYLSFRPGSCGLVDYDDDDDEEVYNPPLGSKQETSTGNDKAVDSHKSKRKLGSSTDNTNEELEPVKKHRLEKNSNGGNVAAACSTCNHAEPPSTRPVTPKSPITDDGKSSSDEPDSEKEDTVSSSSNCLPDAVDTRQSTGEDCPAMPISNSTSEMANGANVTGSEPYSVR
ncbi:uncharacterized protein LOC131224775 isoform X2 [Magnolia sinica]|uniref:uncharacterized protein LOC131224775 isoform X2 n=1 Tax=Magnolia sinica TaxID=86752 RepID=UPI002658EE69|nr:uncharacterized protein LOC131224775 isoform X2 [Magnolia sinica]